MKNFGQSLLLVLIPTIVGLMVGFATFQINLEKRLSTIEAQLNYLTKQGIYEKTKIKDFPKREDAKRIEKVLAEKVF